MRHSFSTVVFATVWLCVAQYADSALPEIPATSEGAQLWEAKREKTIESLLSKPKPEMIAGLGEMLKQLATLNYRDSSERVRITTRAQSLLLSIPGHAEFYRDEINQARAKFEEALKGGDETMIGEARQHLAGKLLFEFPTLEHLPSVETVRVLGEFLSDERGYVKMPEHPTLDDLTDDVAGSPVFRRAAAALGKLPIVNKPVPAKTQFRTPDDVLPWKQWYEQIKAGNRTFRFEGDATEYDLDGPASKDKLARVERAMRRDAERAGGQRKSPTGFEGGSPVAVLAKPVSIAAILAGFVLVAGAVLYFLRSRKTA